MNENVDVSDDDQADCGIKVDRRSIVSRVEQFFTDATQANSKYLYIYICESLPENVVSCLNGISGHLDPRANSRIKDMPGINTSMFYIGCAGSFTELHVEDSIADSTNVIHVYKGKIWMFIVRQDYFRINQIVAQKLKDFSDVDNDAGLATDSCVLPLHHKNLVLTPRFLDEHQIRYEFLMQRAGDLVYVRCGVLNQVINVCLNVAEAIDMGSDAWNLGNELKMLFPCEMCKIENAETNIDLIMSVKVGMPNARSNRCDICTRIFGAKKLLVKH